MKKLLHWRGWKMVFPLPFWAELLLFVICCICLVPVFMQNMQQHILSYILYVLSAYSLTALCIKFPRGISGAKLWLQRHPKISRMLFAREFRLSADLYFEQFINFAYGIFKVVSGAIVGSAWLGADGIYNLVQATIQLFQVIRRKNPGSISDQWRSYRFCGVLIILMHLTLTGLVYLMIHRDNIEKQGEIMLIATAAFVFYSFISGFIRLARDRKHAHPVDSSVRMLKFSQAIFALFSLQVGLLKGFGSGEGWETPLNMATGGIACLFVAATGIYMILRANRELKENKNESR